jgi:hypothetical protein
MRSRKQRGDRLTKKQTKYLRDLRKIIAMLGLDFENIREYPSAVERTAQLERILVHLILGEIMNHFTLVDELVTHNLARMIVGARAKNPRRSKRFQAIKGILEDRIPLHRKFALLRTLTRIPNDVVSAISRLNKLRNYMAHQFFLGASMEKLRYSGQNILSVEGLRLFEHDQERVFEYLTLR